MEHFDDFMKDLLSEIRDFDRVKSGDIPNIDLYMDQVTTFMDEHLGLFRRTDDDKVLTKTMINNYSKYDLLPPTYKKKYTNDHIIMMLFIYYLKPILSITDIKELLVPIRDMFIDNNLPEGFTDLKDFHDRIVENESNNFHVFEERMLDTIGIAKEMFLDVKDNDKRELLSIFATSYLFTIQASAQKHMITQLIDGYLTKNFSKKEVRIKEAKPKEAAPKTTKPKPAKPKETTPKAAKPKEAVPKTAKPKPVKPKEAILDESSLNELNRISKAAKSKDL